MEILIGLFVLLAISVAANGHQLRREVLLKEEIKDLESQVDDLKAAVGGNKEDWRSLTL